MRLLSIHLPRRPLSEAAAYVETAKGHTHTAFFTDQLNDIYEGTEEAFSGEFYAHSGSVFAGFAASDEMLDILKSGVYAWISDCELKDAEDYTLQIKPTDLIVGAEVSLGRSDVYPIETYKNLNISVIAPVLAQLTRVSDGDKVLVQVIIRPVPDNIVNHVALSYRQFSAEFAKKFRAKSWLKSGLPLKTDELVEAKCSDRLFWVTYRIAAFTESKESTNGKRGLEREYARLSEYVKGIGDSLKFLNKQDENQLVLGPLQRGPRFLKKVQERQFSKPFRASSAEVATLFHPPSLGVLPNTAQVLSRKFPAPVELSRDMDDPQMSFFGRTNYRDTNLPIGLRRYDRRRHLYVVGKSGTGKSCLLQLLVKSDIERGYGCAVLDPHGDLVDDILKLVPKHRVKDVVIFDPSDTAFPPCFNPLSGVKPELRTRLVLSFLDSFKRLFSSDWTDKTDHVMRHAILALISVPGANLQSLVQILTDDEYRKGVVLQASDESVKRFWLMEYAARRKELEEGPVARVVNRLNALLTTESIRNILAQPYNHFDFRACMDARKIVLLRISKGSLGATAASLLGSLLIWKMFEAAMSRADVLEEKRQEFFFYVDEFQNFATESFDEILSESRKYGLSLTMAHQYIGQLPATVRSTIFGNVANLLSFRIGSDDAGLVAQELGSRFREDDILNLPMRHFCLKMSIKGQVQEAFSGHTVDIEYPSEHYAKQCIEHSRETYCRRLSS